MQRGRRSADAAAAELQVLSPLLPGARPEPPEYLTAEQMQVWQAGVDRMPLNWFTPDLFPMLCQLCVHVTNSMALAAELAAFDRSLLADEPGLIRFDRLTRIHEREGRAASALMSRLRLTPQSRYNAAVASTAVNSVPKSKPWECE
jgi:hypothetical protein